MPMGHDIVRFIWRLGSQTPGWEGSTKTTHFWSNFRTGNKAYINLVSSQKSIWPGLGVGRCVTYMPQVLTFFPFLFLRKPLPSLPFKLDRIKGGRELHQTGWSWGKAHLFPPTTLICMTPNYPGRQIATGDSCLHPASSSFSSSSSHCRLTSAVKKRAVVY